MDGDAAHRERHAERHEVIGLAGLIFLSLAPLPTRYMHISKLDTICALVLPAIATVSPM